MPLQRTILLLLLSGLLQSWQLHAQTTIPYAGTFHNTLLDAGGTITMTVTYWPGDSISGHVDFTEYPGTSPLCAAGNFTGHQEADSLFHSFVSFDTDPGCGFEWGVPVYLLSALHNGLDSISGMYQAAPAPGVQGMGYYNLANTLHTSISGHQQDILLKLFPNPTAGIMMLHHPRHVQVRELTVLDATGRVVLERPVTHEGSATTLDLSDRPDGLYFVQLRLADGSRSTERVVKE